MSIIKNGFLAAILYAITSTSMAFLNKTVITYYKFNFPFCIMACQMTVTILFLEMMMYWQKIKIPNYNLKAAITFLYPSLGYAIHAILSLMALGSLNIPMYTAVKRCTPLVNLCLAVFILRKPFPSFSILGSIIMITVGCILAVMGDITFDSFAYTVGGLSVIAQGLYLTLVQKSSESLSTLEILYLNSYNTVLPFFILSIATSEPPKIVISPFLKDPLFLMALSTVVCLGAVLNYSLFLCTSMNSALTTSLVAAGKSSIQTIVGLFAFGGISYNFMSMIGITLNLVGGIIYTFVKYKDLQLHVRRKSSSFNKEDITINNNITKA